MSVTFDRNTWPYSSSKSSFGLCDKPSPSTEPAYLDEENGADWIAVVDNYYKYIAYFTGIDNQILLRKDNGQMDSRCDGVLSYHDVIIFVELKQRAQLGSDWIIDAELQLRATISHFEASEYAEHFKIKKAYAANSEHPKFRTNQSQRMDRFYNDTGYIFRIENRIALY